MLCSAGTSGVTWTPGCVSSDCGPIFNLYTITSERVEVNVHFQFSVMEMQMRMPLKLGRRKWGFALYLYFKFSSCPTRIYFFSCFHKCCKKWANLPLKHNKYDVAQHECACALLPLHCNFNLFTWLFKEEYDNSLYHMKNKDSPFLSHSI